MQQWSAGRLAAAIAKLEDAGNPQPKMARMAGVSQSTLNRWARGQVRPGPDVVRRLADALWRRYPDLARELVEASGYPWIEPEPAPEPEPIPDDVMAFIRESGRYSPEQQAEIITMLQQLNGPPGQVEEAARGSHRDADAAG
jgi:transcriptional regulator with XRE-family HTH domain